MWNTVLGWEEAALAGAVARFVSYLTIPCMVPDADVEEQEDSNEMAESKSTDISRRDSGIEV